MARYAAFPNVHWDFSKEANNEKDLDYKRDRVAFLRQNDPYHRPITVHDDHQTYDAGAYDGLLDYRSDQQNSPNGTPHCSNIGANRCGRW